MTLKGAEILRSRAAGVMTAVVVLGLHLIAVLDTVLGRVPSIWPLHNDTVHRAGRAVDFYSVYHAAMQLERGLSPFSMAPDGVTPYYYPFRYLPIVGRATRLLTQLSPADAYCVWIAMLELLLCDLAWSGSELLVVWRQVANDATDLADVMAKIVAVP